MDHHDHHHPGATVLPADPLPLARAEGMPQTKPAHAMHDAGHESPPSESHAASAHGGGVGHGAGMSHDMSDPAMAASMEGEIRTRFWVALALSALVVLISPMGEMIGQRLT